MKPLNFKLNRNSLVGFLQFIEGFLGNGEQSFKVTVSQWEDNRSLDANAQAWVWFNAISQHTGEDLKTVHCRVKRDFGLPIILADESKAAVIRYIMDKTGFERMNDGQQLKMVDAMQITSQMTTKQHAQMRDNLQSYWRDNGLLLEYMNGK